MKIGYSLFLKNYLFCSTSAIVPIMLLNQGVYSARNLDFTKS